MAYWLEYESRDTFLHKGLQPLTKMAIIASIMVVTGIWWNPLFQLFLLIPAAWMVYDSKLPLYWFNVIILAVVTSLYPVAMTSLGQTNPAIYKVLDPVWATTPLLVHTFPIAGKLGITPGGLMWLAASELRSIVMATYGFVFIYTTSVAEVTDTLLAFHVPQAVVFVISIAYKLIPYLNRVVDHILSAQRLRGWSINTINPVKIIKRTMPLMNPLMRRVAIMTEQITTSSQIRGFGSGKVSQTRKIHLRRVDYALIAVSVLFAAVSLFLMSFYRVGLL